ncbi:unnamed protein product [Cuscuta epithymum]|nr:unnamed protein product [Cuscuta epithymum]CAH9125576.1 unnamed protein product [Cuscuta epithymum]
MPETGELSQQNIKDRYYGVNDPVAMKLLGKAGEMPSLEPPDDESIMTLYVGGVDARITEQDLRDQFYAHGEIESVKMVSQRGFAFITYTTREGAERAAEELANKLVIKGLRLRLLWGRPQAPKPPESEMTADDARHQAATVAHSGLLPRALISQQQQQIGGQDPPTPMPYFNIPPMPPQPDRAGALYPSMDPQRMGALSSASGSGENRSGGPDKPPPQGGGGYPFAYPPLVPPPHGQFYPPYYPPQQYGGYIIPPPSPQSYQQYPPPHHHQATMAPPPPPSGGQAPHQQQSQPGPGQHRTLMQQEPGQQS